MDVAYVSGINFFFNEGFRVKICTRGWSFQTFLERGPAERTVIMKVFDA